MSMPTYCMTGVLHLVNQMPTEWFSKKQVTVETLTYGSEFIAAKLVVQQSMGICVYATCYNT